jgi:iron complex outermembrane receptor protein
MTKMPVSRRGAAVAVVAAFVFGAVHAQQPPAATASAPPAVATAPADVQLAPIFVEGLRASLEKSLEIKRNAAVVLDSINATELGRFPDADVADSLSHLSGITISRTTGGEGQKVSVRGLGPEYNLVTLNNRILATDDDGRDLAFDVLPSEIISGADVLKSAQASALEGSIGGTVNLRTASPFDNPGLHGGVHLEGSYNAMSLLHGRKVSAYASDTNDSRTMGFLLGAVHSENRTRTDSLNAYNQNIYGPTTFPFNGGTQPVYATPCCITFGSIFDDKKRDALSGSVEWRPSEAFRLVVDGLWTKLNDPQIGYNESYYFPAPDAVGTGWSNPVYNNGIISGVTVSGFQPEMVNNTMNRKVTTSLLGVKATWKPASRLTLTGDGYVSKAIRPEGGNDAFVTAGLVTDQPVAQDTLILQNLPGSLPSLNVLVPPSQLGLGACPAGTASPGNAGLCSYTALMNSRYLSSNSFWSTHYVGLNGYTVHDQVNGLTLDGTLDVGAGILDRILFGIGSSRREKGRWDASNDWSNGSGQYGSLYTTAGAPVQPSPYSFGSQGYNVVSLISPPNFMHGAGGSYPTVLPQLDVNQLLAFLQSLNGKTNPLTGNPFDFAATLPQVNPFNSYNVSERTISLYGEAELAGSNWSGNVGLRIVHTATTASTAVAVPDWIWNQTPGAVAPTYFVHYPTSQDSKSDGRYTLALPSLNVNYWAVPDTVQFRFGAAETMSRPNLNQLAPTSSNNAINGDPQLYYGGTAGLRPVKALQADFSVEWYYQPHAALSGAVFVKKIRDDIYSGTQANQNLGTLDYEGGSMPPGAGAVTPVAFPWTVNAPANGARSLFSGFELSWQHMLENGFGVHLQFTRTNSKGWDQFGNYAGSINAVPPTTVSVGLLYEKGPLSADLNWDHAAGYTLACSSCTEVPGWPAIADPFTWLTASLHYRITKEIRAYVEGRNLTDAIARSYLNGNPLLPWAPGQSVGASTSGVGAGYSAYGRTYTAGFSYQF